MGQMDKKQQMMVLGGLGAVLIVVFFVLDPAGLRSGGGGTPPPTPPPATGDGTTGTPIADSGANPPPPGAPPLGAPGADPALAAMGSPPPGATPGAAPGTAGAATAQSLQPQLPSRPDPMAPLNPPLALAAIRPTWTGNTIGGLPGLSYSAVVPRVAEPPRNAVIEGVKPPTIEARDLRLSGVLLNGSLYVILEVDSLGQDPRGYVVKPGDEVEGNKVLKIERYAENGQMVTRALVRTRTRDERYVYLRSGNPIDPSQQGGQPGGPGAGGPGAGGPGGGGSSGS